MASKLDLALMQPEYCLLVGMCLLSLNTYLFTLYFVLEWSCSPLASGTCTVCRKPATSRNGLLQLTLSKTPPHLRFGS